ncbi:unnamed protein product [Larinioides sclopetarius]|uniref:Uncharacterized protein n=1 Tax=Larinioides sclopetarius TaxID=280406 RepID=A0AAV1Z218_9ARAC
MKDLKSERGRSSAMENSRTDGNKKALKERQKRPDMQLYVPRALRGVENKTMSSKNSENLNQEVGKKTSQKSTVATSLTNSLNNLPSVSSEKKHKNSISMNLKPKSIENEIDNAVKLPTDETVVECAASNNAVVDETLTISTNNPPAEMEDPQNFQKSSSSVQKVMPYYSNCTKNVEIVNNTTAIISENVTENIDQSVIVKSIPSNTVDLKKEMDCNVEISPCKAVRAKSDCTLLENILCSPLDTKSEASSTTTADSSYASDMVTLNISDKFDETDISLKIAESSNVLPKEKDDSWESMFDDDGECLDSNLVKELSSVTGKIQARTAKNNYADYQPVSESVPQEYEHIVELYGFPREFVTQDLISAFSIFQQSSFSIKWVDDCHALAIFTSPALANQALQIKHPFMKVRPLSEGIKESKAKARWCAHYAEPQKPRPATSAVLARRLVSGALGLKVQATKEQRDHERSILKEAKEKRRLKAKQKEAIWDGSVI